MSEQWQVVKKRTFFAVTDPLGQRRRNAHVPSLRRSRRGYSFQHIEVSFSASSRLRYLLILALRLLHWSRLRPISLLVLRPHIVHSLASFGTRSIHIDDTPGLDHIENWRNVIKAFSEPGKRIDT